MFVFARIRETVARLATAMLMFFAPLFRECVEVQQRIRCCKGLLLSATGDTLDPVIISMIDDIPLFVGAISNTWESIELRVDAALVLSNMLSGDTKTTSHVAVCKGVLATLIAHANDSRIPLGSELARQCTWALGNIAADSDALRELLCVHGVLGVVCRGIDRLLSEARTEEASIENALWVLSGMCDCSFNRRFDYDMVLETTARVMQCKECQTIKIKYSVSLILASFTTPGTKAGLADMLVERNVHVMLISDYIMCRVSRRTTHNALIVLTCIAFESEPKYTQRLVDDGILDAVKCVLDKNTVTFGRDCTITALGILSNLVADKDHIETFLSSGLPRYVRALYDACEADRSIRIECAYCCANAIYNNSTWDFEALHATGMLSVLVDTLKQEHTPLELRKLCLSSIERMTTSGRRS